MLAGFDYQRRSAKALDLPIMFVHPRSTPVADPAVDQQGFCQCPQVRGHWWSFNAVFCGGNFRE